MSNKFYDGQPLDAIYFANGEQVTVVDSMGCISLKVVMESGQMAEVPWALATYDNSSPRKWNLATIEGVMLKE
jgi:hypothetical protein